MVSSKIFLIASVLLSGVVAEASVAGEIVEPISSKNAEKLLNKAGVECNATNVSAESLFDSSLNDTELNRVKCAMGCILKYVGVIAENNEFDRKGIEKLIEINLNWSSSEDEADIDPFWEACNLDKFGQKCTKLVAQNECDATWNFYQCILKICEPQPPTNSSDNKNH